MVYEFLFDYAEPDHGEKVNLCYMDARVSLHTQNQMIFEKLVVNLHAK